MSLGAPTVVGPLSECSSAIRVQGQVPGATVAVFADTLLVATGTANSWDQTFPLQDPKAGLPPGTAITARQTAAGSGEPSLASEAVKVQKRPSTDKLHVGFASHLYICGECVFLDGMVPGAAVEVTAGALQLSAGSADDGTFVAELSSHIAPGQTLVARQTACGVVGLPTTAKQPDKAATLQAPIRAPRIQGPLIDCDETVTLLDLMDGAEVTVDRKNPDGSAGLSDTRCIPYSSVIFVLTEKLREGELVTARQAFPSRECANQSPASSPVAVASPKTIPIPLVAPLCAGSTSVHLSGLRPGALVRVHVDALEYLWTAPKASYSFEGIAPLEPGAHVTAQQTACDELSDFSPVVIVDPAPVQLDPPSIISPLYECAAAVPVTNIHPGSKVYIYSQLLDAPIGQKYVSIDTDTIPVAPLLFAGDTISAIVVGCGLTSGTSAQVDVQSADITTPQVQNPLYIQQSDRITPQVVTISNVLPGAHVDIYVNDFWRGTAIASTTSVVFNLILFLRDKVTAQQWLCVDSPVSPPVWVTEPPKPPAIQFSATPADAYINVGQSATLRWQVDCQGLACTVHLVGKDSGDSVGFVHTVLDKQVPTVGQEVVTPTQTFTKYTITANSAGGTVTKEITVQLYAPLPGNGKTFCFKMTGPSAVTPCFGASQYAADGKSDTAKKLLEAQYGGYTAEEIDCSKFNSGNACL